MSYGLRNRFPSRLAQSEEAALLEEGGLIGARGLAPAVEEGVAATVLEGVGLGTAGVVAGAAFLGYEAAKGLYNIGRDLLHEHERNVIHNPITIGGIKKKPKPPGGLTPMPDEDVNDTPAFPSDGGGIRKKPRKPEADKGNSNKPPSSEGTGERPPPPKTEENDTMPPLEEPDDDVSVKIETVEDDEKDEEVVETPIKKTTTTDDSNSSVKSASSVTKKAVKKGSALPVSLIRRSRYSDRNNRSGVSFNNVRYAQLSNAYAREERGLFNTSFVK
jgi:hypothetical protein